jgi:peptidyl-prolyl cis-trans isomerase A (cyclophilin A)
VHSSCMTRFSATARIAGLLLVGVGLPLAGQGPRTRAEKAAVLNNVRLPFWSTKAPATFVAEMLTSKGKVAIEFTRAWAPNGVDRFYNLVRAGYYDNTRFYRVSPGFVAQFGVAADPDYANYWGRQAIKPDRVLEHNARGTLSYAQVTENDRTTNVFINLKDNLNLDTLGFSPIGRVIEGMDVVDSLYSGYADMPITDPPIGDPKRMYRETNKYLDKTYPKMDRIIRITIRPL